MQVEKTLDSDEVHKAICEYLERSGLKVTAMVLPATEGDMSIFVRADVINKPDTRESK